jgi:Fic family protein
MRIPLRPPPWQDLLRAALTENARFVEIIQGGNPVLARDKYLHWDNLRHRKPPEGLNHAEWWAAIKLARRPALRELPLREASGQPFRYGMNDAAHEMVHTIDRRASGEITLSEIVTNPHTRNRYVVSSLIEEAITSSQLEGASTTRQAAKDMIRTGRPPRNRSERMILSNYHAMEFVGSIRDRELTPKLVCEIHRRVTLDNLKDPGDAGRIQTPEEDRIEVLWNDGTVLHVPPSADQLPGRLEDLCRFANGDGPEGFLHPVVRSVLLHFWLAYDHPFVDGNGRTARAVFYWSMLHRGYWLAEYLSVSSILRRAPAKYARSFLYSETDDGDLSYFILYHLEVICRSITSLHEYLSRKTNEIRQVESLIKRSTEFNYRQLALLSHALRSPGARYTFTSHATSHNIAYQSARTDLISLREKDLLRQWKVGKSYYFTPVEELAARLGESSPSQG